MILSWQIGKWGENRGGRHLKVTHPHLPQWENQLNMPKTKKARNRSIGMVLYSSREENTKDSTKSLK